MAKFVTLGRYEVNIESISYVEWIFVSQDTYSAVVYMSNSTTIQLDSHQAESLKELIEINRIGGDNRI